MSLDDDLNFGITLDNGDNNDGHNTHRNLQASKSEPQTAHESSNSQDFSVGKEDYNLGRAGHPNVCLATIAFKGAAFLMYR